MAPVLFANFASELKALHSVCDYIMTFPPGHVLDTKGKPYHRYDDPAWRISAFLPTLPVDLETLREALIKSVRRRDGVEYGWINVLKELAVACVTPAMMRIQPEHWSIDPPETKEA